MTHYRTIAPYQQSAGEAFKQEARQPGWHVQSTDFVLWYAAASVKRFVDRWFDLVVQN